VTPVSFDVAAARAGVSAGTLRRWVREGVIPQYDGTWTPAAVAGARLVARMRERGHSIQAIRRGIEDGRLAFGHLSELFAGDEGMYTLRQASRETGLDAPLIERVLTALGMSGIRLLSDGDIQLLRYVSAVLGAGLPLEAMLQLARVYGQAIAQIADAEVRLVHLYVHEPMMRSGTPASEMGEELVGLAEVLLPLASPVLDQLHQRLLGHFVEQDVVGHMEAELDDDSAHPPDLGRMRVAIAFADLTGYTRMTEEVGELEALGRVERFVEAVSSTLPDDARVLKTIGDEVMVVGSDAAALIDWAVGFQALQAERPLPRIGLHYGYALYREGDYYGRDVNIASRVAARSTGGEVLVTRPIVEAAGAHLQFERIADVRLKGFTDSTEIFVARRREPLDAE
jgi:adenylate cyclase